MTNVLGKQKMITVVYALVVIPNILPIAIKMIVVIALVKMQTWTVMEIAVYPMVRPILMIAVYVLGVIQDI